jgi:hypothetical protein
MQKSFNMLYLNSKQDRPYDTIIHNIAPRPIKKEIEKTPPKP